MLDQSSSPSPTTGPGDMLTQVLLGLRLDGVEYGRCQFAAPWALAFPAQRDARFHFVARGVAWLRVGESPWQRLAAGDAVLLPRGHAHVLASTPEVAPVAIHNCPRTPVSDEVYRVDLGAAVPTRLPPVEDAAADTVLFCGAMRFNLDPLHPLLALMPERMLAGDLVKRDPAVPALLDAMEREAALDRIGACGILSRLADVLAASIIRAWVECACGDASGWIAAVHCPSIGKVIAAIHADPARNWTVPELAQLMGASRSRFADAFTRTVGESPARYVAKVKMFQARRWIEQDGMRVAVAANRLGYDSEASFSRAFKRIVGMPPSSARPAATTSRPRRPVAPNVASSRPPLAS